MGGTLGVTVDVTITGVVYGSVLGETVSWEWVVSVVDNDGAMCNADETKWLWGGAQTGTKTVIYNVAIPVGTASGNYLLIETILATVGGETVGPSIVIGDGEVSVTGSEAATIVGVVAALLIAASGGYHEDVDLDDDGKVISLGTLRILQAVVG